MWGLHRTTLSIYRIAPEDKAWLYNETFTHAPSLPATAVSQSEPGAASHAPVPCRGLERAATAPPDSDPATFSGRRDSSSNCSSSSLTSSGRPSTANTTAPKCVPMPAKPPAGSGHGKWLVSMSDCLPPCIGSVGGDTGDNLSELGAAPTAPGSVPSGCFCPAVLYGRLSSRLRGGDARTACLSYALFGPCCACTMAAPLRTQLRRKYDLPEQPFNDGIAHLCCSPCAVWQEYRELEAREGPWEVYQVTQLQAAEQQREMRRSVKQLKAQRQQLQLCSDPPVDGAGLAGLAGVAAPKDSAQATPRPLMSPMSPRLASS